MKLDDVDNLLVKPALNLCVDVSGKPMYSAEAHVMVLAIGLQESRFAYREQVGGPARSYWQFEQGGGVRGVVRHHAVAGYMAAIAKALDYTADESTLYYAMADNGLLAACMARLLLWTDPHALPSINDAQGAWDLYQRVWRPGRPRRETWDALHDQAIKQVTT